MAMRLDEVVSGVKADVAVKIFGADPATLERLGADIQRAVSRVPGVADLQAEQLSGAAQLQIAVDRGQIARYGLNVDDVRQAVETVVGGITATDVLDGPRRLPVVVRFPDAFRADGAAIGSLLLTAPAGERVPLMRIADVRETQAPEMIAHEDAERRLVQQHFKLLVLVEQGAFGFTPHSGDLEMGRHAGQGLSGKAPPGSGWRHRGRRDKIRLRCRDWPR